MKISFSPIKEESLSNSTSPPVEKVVKSPLKPIKARETKSKQKTQNIKQKTTKFLQRISSSINDAFKLTSKFHHINSSKYSIKLKDILSKDTMDTIKREQYNKRWQIVPIPILPKVNPSTTNKTNNVHHSSISSSESLSEDKYSKLAKSLSFRNKALNNDEMLDKLFSNKSEKKFHVICGNKKLDNLKDLKSFYPPQGIKTPAMILKDSEAEISKKNNLLRYENTLKEKMGEYIEYADRFSSIYDLDQIVLQEIKNNKVGVSIPGNFLNYLDDPDNFTFIKVIYPSFVNLKIKKYIPVPEKTQLPKPPGLFKNYTKVTYKQLYPD